jgi:hypothetical protein
VAKALQEMVAYAEKKKGQSAGDETENEIEDETGY